jgi:pimeloyl-ACP methyl ester carboxylesterase
MKIVLLPGLDGTGNSFNSLLRFLPVDEVTVIALPDTGEQTYEALVDYCRARMPNEPYILVAESYSGPIGIKLAANDNGMMKRLVLVATFASPPKPYISKLCSFLPIKWLIRLPLSGLASRMLFLGINTPKEVLESFLSSVASVPSEVISQRLRVASSFELGVSSLSVPVVYIQPTNDVLVPEKCFSVIEKLAANIELKRVHGPHFILQTNPKVCAEIIASGDCGAEDQLGALP